MNFQSITAAFTRSPAPDGLCHLVLTRPETEPSMRFTRPIPGARPSGQPAAVQNRSRRFCLSVGSHLCARASFRHSLTGLPLPSASSYSRPQSGHHRYSYRAFTPSVHAHVGRTQSQAQRRLFHCGCAPLPLVSLSLESHSKTTTERSMINRPIVLKPACIKTLSAVEARPKR